MASVIGTILFVIVLVAALGAQEYMSSLQEQSSQGSQQAQQLLNQKGAEILVYSTPAAGLTVTNKGGVSSNVVKVVLKFGNGTVYTFPEATLLPSGASVLARSLIPGGSCGGATCVQKYDSILSGAAPGSLVGLVTSLGNTFWNPCVSVASNSYVEDNQGLYRSTSASNVGFVSSSVSAQTATATVSGPSTVSNDAFLSTGGQIQSCFAKNRDWVFYISYADGRLYYKSAPDAATWTTNTTIGVLGDHATPLQHVQALCTSTSVYLAYGFGVLPNEFYYAVGTFKGDTIDFTTVDQFVEPSLNADVSQIFMSFDSAGNLWIAPRVQWWDSSVLELPAVNITTGTYANCVGSPPSEVCGQWIVRIGQSSSEIPLGIVPFTSGKMALVETDVATLNHFNVTVWTGSAWTSQVTFTDADNSCNNGVGEQSCTVTSVGDTLYFVVGNALGTREVLLYSFAYGDSSWVGPSTIVTLDVQAHPDATITTNGTALIVAYDTEETSSGVDYCTSTEAGSTWACTGVFAADENGPYFVGGSTFMAGGTAWGVTWITSTGCPPSLCSPYTLRYARLATTSSSVTTPASCSSSATLEPSLAGQWNENAPFPSSKCGNALYCALNSGYDFCVTDSYPANSAVFGQVVDGRVSTWNGRLGSCSYPEPSCRPDTNGAVVDCPSYSGYMYCVDQVGDWTSSPLTTGGFGNWTYLGDVVNSFDSVAESCGAVGSRMACIDEFSDGYTFPLNSTGGTGMPNECAEFGSDWWHSATQWGGVCDAFFDDFTADISGISSACVGLSAGLECQGGPGVYENDTVLYPINSTGGILNATLVGPAFGGSVLSTGYENQLVRGESCTATSDSMIFCVGGSGFNDPGGKYPPNYTVFGTVGSSTGDIAGSQWTYHADYPFAVTDPWVKAVPCCSESPSPGANIVSDGSTFVLVVGGAYGPAVDSYALSLTNESYSYLFPGASCPSGQCNVGSSTAFECGAPPSSSTTTTTTTTILNSEGNWTSYVPVWVLNSTVPWSYVYNVFVSTSGLVIVQAGANGLYRVGLTGAITQLSSGWSYPPDTIPISDSSAHGTYVITEVTWSSPPEILVMKNGSLLQTLTVAEGISGYTVMDISADGQFIVFVGNSYIELFQGQGRT